MPLVALLPLHAPVAEHDVAFVLDQVRVDAPPFDTLTGFALSDTVGAGAPATTLTVTDCDALPPVPLQVSVKVLVVLSALIPSAPAGARAPDHAPDAVQLVALVDDQASVVAPPELIALGVAEILTVGVTGVPIATGGRISITGLYESAIQAKAAIDGT